jgi:diaminopimelate decarboxylase
MLYEAHHDILLVIEPTASTARFVADVVCPVCESRDYLALDRTRPEPKAGDLQGATESVTCGGLQMIFRETAEAVR